jgi:two-component system response regulator AtoC
MSKVFPTIARYIMNNDSVFDPPLLTDQWDSMETPLIGISSNIEKIRKLIERVANTSLNVLICGETGVGKEVVVMQLYVKSNRCNKAFVKVNCAALPDTLLESEMFGYERGAFTGAERRTRGKFEQAHGGVLFLDEIGDMSPPLQSKLLHALQDGRFTRLGSEKEVSTDTWVITATNRDLQADVAAGRFREDLYHRLSTITLHIEPLRNRKEDIPLLIEYYSKIYATKTDGTHFNPLSSTVIGKLIEHSWPGNVRELQNELRRMIVLGDSDTLITDRIAPAKTLRTSQNALIPDFNSTSWVDYFGLNSGGLGGGGFSLHAIQKKASNMFEKQLISNVLAKTGWNRSKATKILGISYKSLLAKIRELELQPPPELL